MGTLEEPGSTGWGDPTGEDTGRVGQSSGKILRKAEEFQGNPGFRECSEG